MCIPYRKAVEEIEDAKGATEILMGADCHFDAQPAEEFNRINAENSPLKPMCCSDCGALMKSGHSCGQDILTQEDARKLTRGCELKNEILHEIRIQRAASKANVELLQAFAKQSHLTPVTPLDVREYGYKKDELLGQIHASEDAIDNLLLELDGLK